MAEARPTHTLRRTFPRFGWMNLLGSPTSRSFATSAKRVMAA